jgi:hypothetical protein
MTMTGQREEVHVPSVEEMRQHLADQVCPWCGAGPWRSLSIHTYHKHGWSADDLREIADLPARRPTVSQETSELLADYGRERETRLGSLRRYQQENVEEVRQAVARATAERARRQRAITHCLRGHPLSGENLRVTGDGFRQCRTCRLEASRILTEEEDAERRRMIRANSERKRRARGSKPQPPKLEESCGCGSTCRIPEGNKRHGTMNGYHNFGCRCEDCRKANTRHMAARRREKAKDPCPTCGGAGGVYAGRCRPCYERGRRG